jgi:hypothetical protein
MRDYEILRKALMDAWRGQYCSDCELNSLCQDDDSNCWFKQAADAIEELLAELVTIRNQLPRWISVEERLPESGERVLIMFKPLEGEENISIGWLTKSGFDCYDDSVYFFRSVTHWMPLPEPPKGVE